MFEFFGRLFNRRTIAELQRENAERRRAEAAVRESEARMRAVLDTAVDGIITINERGAIESINPAVQRLFGYTREELIGQNVNILMPSPYREEHDQYLENYRRTGQARIIGIGREVVGRRKDGTVFPIDLSVSEVRLGDRRVFTGMLRDISDRRRIELELSEAKHAAERSLAQLQAVIENMTDGVIVVDAGGRFLLVNRAFSRLHGLENMPDSMEEYRRSFQPHDLSGQPLRIEDRPLSRALRGETFGSVELEVHRVGQGLMFIGAYGGAPIRDESGAVAMVVMSLRDITARKHAEQALRESEQRFRTMADSAPVLIWMCGPRQEGEYFNRTWLEFTGRALEQEVGNGWLESIHPEDQPALAAWDQAFSQRRPYRTQLRLRRADDRYRWVLVSGVPRFTPDGHFEGYIGSCVDVTNQKRAEEERATLLASERSARSAAERASRMKDEFLATLSHELRTPLNAILGWSQLLHRSRLTEDLRREGLETIERNARLQTQLISDLLDMSRIISGKLRLEVEEIELSDVIAAALETVRPAAEAKHIHVESECNAQPVFVHGDPGRLQQICWNLLSNAIKFTPANGRVRVNLQVDEGQAVISVTDTGVGIRADFLPYLFERFRQMDSSTTREHRGLGLGLSIVKQLVELHGGTVAAQSEGAGRGATFTVRLPLSVVHARPAGHFALPMAGSEVPEAAFGGAALQGVRVLAVDDEPDARELVRRILAECGAEVATAESTGQALEWLKQHGRPDVLISDIGMPREDGYDLIRKVRELSAECGGTVPALALTAFARPDDRKHALFAGYTAHLSKPVDPAELQSVVATLAGRSYAESPQS